MNIAVLLASALWLLAPTPQYNPGVPTTTVRKSFAVAAETVLDEAGSLDISADPAHFDGPMQQLKTAQANLKAMAGSDRENTIASDLQDVVFQIKLCHIQAKDGAPTDKCTAQVNSARHIALQALNRHKSGDAWIKDPPE